MPRAGAERGAALVEFALVSLVLYLILATTIDFGRMMFSAQAIQDVARVAAREYAVAPLDARLTFEQARDVLQARVYDPKLLVLDITALSDAELDAAVAQLPIVNRALRPLMIFEQVGDRTLLRYPGALLVDATAPSGYTVAIPRVLSRGENGVETLGWLDVIEEVRAETGCPMRGPFSLVYVAEDDTCGALPSDPLPASARGLVALRINYPYQAAAMSGFTPNADGPVEPNLGNVITADDALVDAPAPSQGALRPDDEGIGPYAGPYGLGRQLAFARAVRPFRKVLAAQAIYRREVFE